MRELLDNLGNDRKNGGLQSAGTLFKMLEDACVLTETQTILEYERTLQNREVAEELNISRRQAAIFTYIFNHVVNESYNVSISELSRKMGVTNFDLLKSFDDFQKLDSRRLIILEYGHRNNELRFNIPRNTFGMILTGADGKGLDNRPKSFAEFTERVYELLRDVLKDSSEMEYRMKNLEDLIASVKSFPEIKWLKSIGFFDVHIAMVAAVCYKKIRSDEDSMAISELLERLYYSAHETLRVRNEIIRGRHKLIRSKVMELTSGFFLDGYALCLTAFAQDKLLNGFDFQQKHAADIRFKYLKQLKFEELDKKELFFDRRLSEETERLRKVLGYRNFKKFKKRAAELNLNSGFATLLYGIPGTGKTELVKQLAIETKRDILMINISDIRDKFVGESEKRLNAIFEEYEKALKAFKREPILLFNEADALISKRTSVNNSVDQMNNSMQNILLQRMEDFEGILFATTNLKSSLDKAFDRRFTLKLEFGLPSARSYKSILDTKLVGLPTEQIDLIAKNFRLTGGQIDNLLKNIEVKQLLGEDLSDEFISNICESETNKKNHDYERGILGY